MTRVRNPFILALSLALLASAGALGVLLRHDGEFGTVEDLHSIDAAGEEVRLKGDLLAFEAPTLASWQAVLATLDNRTFLLDVEEPMVLVTGIQDSQATPGDDRVIDGRVVYLGVHPDDPARTLVVVAAESVHEPYFAW